MSSKKAKEVESFESEKRTERMEREVMRAPVMTQFLTLMHP